MVIASATEWVFNDAVQFQLSILLYDYFLTIDLEVTQVWNQRLTTTSILFLMNRYIFPLYVLLGTVVISIPLNDKACNTLGHVSGILYVSNSATILLIFTVRTWAIFMKSWKVLTTVGLVAVAKLAMNIASFTNVTSYSANLYPPICYHDNTNLYFPASAYLAISFDSVVFWLTFYRTIRSTIEMKRIGVARSLTYYILRDGIGRLSITILYLATFQPPALLMISEVLYNIISNVMINRLMLNLRLVSASHMRGGISWKTISEPSYATNSFIGNLGAPMMDHSAETDTLDVGEAQSLTNVDE
ncbi:hypothetical protein BD410DRAFT_786312 [Rickenella mellea]|uniref:DUF6533 domain-containing protein n=1 Tax=Rickenella mellea TaxID=50990 RepID=A0A4Y7QA23_9AGAM|nr:hypothetical protein BD410DRAFT_786312 [Rickenella mellea]